MLPYKRTTNTREQRAFRHCCLKSLLTHGAAEAMRPNIKIIIFLRKNINKWEGRCPPVTKVVGVIAPCPPPPPPAQYLWHCKMKGWMSLQHVRNLVLLVLSQKLCYGTLLLSVLMSGPCYMCLREQWPMEEDLHKR